MTEEEMQRRTDALRVHWQLVARENGIRHETYRYRLQKLKWGPAKAAMYPVQGRLKR
ncbi:hypothetical protein [Modicisalibacter radicis]|uniref:hypothetical protein n=1 Tax=Halomonas sp. EAR18 TaxID=2518972 RepID=UPI0014447D4F|nr:hypothetical protein [Halomonas sp. EAR18]